MILHLEQISPIHIVSILEGEEGSIEPEDEEIIRSSHAAVRDKGWVFGNSEIPYKALISTHHRLPTSQCMNLTSVHPSLYHAA